MRNLVSDAGNRYLKTLREFRHFRNRWISCTHQITHCVASFNASSMYNFATSRPLKTVPSQVPSCHARRLFPQLPPRIGLAVMNTSDNLKTPRRFALHEMRIKFRVGQAPAQSWTQIVFVSPQALLHVRVSAQGLHERSIYLLTSMCETMQTH